MDPQDRQVIEPELVSVFSDDSIQEVAILARRLKEAHGGELDDSAILAVAEATGAPVDYVRLAIQVIPDEDNSTPIERIRGSFLAFDLATRRYIMSGLLATVTALAIAFGTKMSDASGFTGTLALIVTLGAVWNCVVARDSKTAVFSGAIFGGMGFFMTTLFMLILTQFPGVRAGGPEPAVLIPSLLGGALVGVLAHNIGKKHRKKLGLADPAGERHELLQQLLEIQDQLKSDERYATFLSVDIVGSTKMKADSDPLSIEFTFNEYHKFVETVALKHGGRIHSTAGDGVIVVFDNPQKAFTAGKAMLAGLFEFNAFRNRLEIPIELRGGLHTGSVLAPGQDIKSVNFAHVIDIAAHMQKVSPIGCLAVSDHTASFVQGGKSSIGSEVVEAHDVSGVVWRPRNTIRPTAVTL